MHCLPSAFWLETVLVALSLVRLALRHFGLKFGPPLATRPGFVREFGMVDWVSRRSRLHRVGCLYFASTVGVHRRLPRYRAYRRLSSCILATADLRGYSYFVSDSVLFSYFFVSGRPSGFLFISYFSYLIGFLENGPLPSNAGHKARARLMGPRS